MNQLRPGTRMRRRHQPGEKQQYVSEPLSAALRYYLYQNPALKAVLPAETCFVQVVTVR